MGNARYCGDHLEAGRTRRIRAAFWLGAAFGVGSASVGPAHAQAPATVAIVAVTCAVFTGAGEIEVEGEVRNISSRPINNLMLSAVFNGPDGQFVSTSDLLVKFDPVMPGQVSPFDGFGNYNPVVHTVTVTPALQDGPSLPFTGNGEARCGGSEQ